jgi:3D (Asp-Asp-Asp) domain-containing protein
MRKFIITTIIATLAIVLHPISALADQETGRVEKTDVKTEKIPFQTKYVFNRDMTPGRVKLATAGVNGLKTTTITTIFENGVQVDKKSDVKTEAAKDEVFHMGRSGFMGTDRGSFSRAKVVTMEATAYLPTDGSSTGKTASGIKAGYGIVAVDKRQIKLGTLLFVEGYGFALAADTGGAIKTNKIDVCMTDRQKAMKWGRRKVKVHIFNERHTSGMYRQYRN